MRGRGGGGVKLFTIAKKTKRGRRKLISHLELFQKVQFVNLYIKMTCKHKKSRKTLQGSFSYICMYQPGGKIWLFYSKYRIDVVSL